MTGKHHLVPHLFRDTAELVEQKWMAGTTAKTLRGTFEALGRYGHLEGLAENMIGVVLMKLTELAQDPTRSTPQWRKQAVQLIKSVVSNEKLPAGYVEHSQRVTESVAGLDPYQTTDDLKMLYRRAKHFQPDFKDLLEDIAYRTGAEADIPDLKGVERAMERVAELGTAARLTDILRGSLYAKDLNMVAKVNQALLDSGVLRFFKDRHVQPAGGGYRDTITRIAMQNGMPPIISEAQVLLEPVAEYKKGDGHKFYEAIRAIYNAGENLTDKGQQKLQELNEQMKAGYDAAFAKGAKGEFRGPEGSGSPEGSMGGGLVPAPAGI
jgi:hypothetical protein